VRQASPRAAADGDAGGARYLLGQLFWSSLVGAAIGWLEVLGLESGGFFLGAREALETVLVYAVLGALVGGAAACAVRLALAIARRAASGGGPLGARLAAVVPSFAVIWVVLGGRINVLHLPDALSLPSLAANAALLAAFGLAAWAWSRRPWGVRADRWLLAAAVAAGAASAVGLLRAPSPHEIAGAAPARAGEAPNVVLILVDTLRADHLGVYGYARSTSPRIDAFAAEGMVFERAYSTTNWTRPAVASLFTSTMPSRHNATALDRALSPDLPLLAEALRGRGYRTAFFTVGPNVEPADGYGRGVDHFFHGRSQKAVARTVFFNSIVLRLVPGVGKLLPGRRHASALTGDPAEITDRALEWARAADPARPFFVYLHYLGPHSPYRPPPPFDRAFSEVGVVERVVDPPHAWSGKDAFSPADTQQMIDKYDGEVAWHDAHIGRLLDGLREAGRLDQAIVAIVADHGEGFGEHGVWGHNAGLFEEVVRIPMIFRGTGVRPGRTRVAASLVDLAPTLAELSGAASPREFDGASLAPWLAGAGEGERTVFVENPLNDEIGVRSGEWAYFEGKTGDGFQRWLFRAEDARQTEELSARHPEVAEELRRLAAERRDRDRSVGVKSVEIELDAERRRMLEALGYVEEGEDAAP
jgi:arylsulfatase A-like enzyme